MAGSKKFRDKLCVYCRDRKSSTADHVFPREFFQVEERGHLPKVPSCSICNNKKSQIEHYLTAVLPFGASHQNAKKALTIDVAKRLSKNKKLHNTLKESFTRKLINDSKGDTGSVLTIPIESDKVNEFCSYVGFGLLWHHWNIYLPKNFSSRAFTPSNDAMEHINRLLNLTTLRVHEVLGDETIQYKGVAVDSDDGISVWAIQLLGGVSVLDEVGSVLKNSFVVIITGSEENLKKIDALFAT